MRDRETNAGIQMARKMVEPGMESVRRAVELWKSSFKKIVKVTMTKQEVLDIIKAAVDEEPELPGEMPDEMYEFLHNADKEALSEVERITVRITKQGILERAEEKLNNLWKE
jgi:hypothetical protein